MAIDAATAGAFGFASPAGLCFGVSTETSGSGIPGISGVDFEYSSSSSSSESDPNCV